MQDLIKKEEDEDIHLMDYVNVLRKHLWTVVIIFIIVVAVVTIKTYKTVPLYLATASIVIEKQQVNIGIQEMISQNALPDFLNEIEFIKSRGLAKRVIDKLDLINDPEFNSDDGTNKDKSEGIQSLPKPTDDIGFVNGFLGRMRIELKGNTGIVGIGFVGKNPVSITKIANTISKTYIELDWEKQYQMSKGALDWLNKQIGDVKIVLEESELILQKYKKDNDIIMVENVGAQEGSDQRQNIVLQNLADLNNEVTSAKIDRIKLEVVYKKLKEFKTSTNKFNQLLSLPVIANNILIQNLKASYAGIEKDYVSIFQRYGVKHPKVIELNAKLKSMKDIITNEIELISDSISIQFEIAKKREDTLLGILEEQKAKMFALGDKAIQYGVLKREVDTNRLMYETLLTRMKETNITGDLQSGDIRVLDDAVVPSSPIKPKKKLNVLLGMVVGLALGVGVAFLIEYMDNTLKTKEDVEKYLNVALLGIVGHLTVDNEEKRDDRFGDLITHSIPKSNISESIRAIRTNVMFTLPDNPKKVILITSSIPGEGKSFVSANLAVVFAQTGKKVLVIDADMRKPTMHKLFAADKTKGLSNVLAKTSDVMSSMIETKVNNVYLMACGPIPPDPSELLGSQRMVEMLDELKGDFDIIIIDSPPVLTVTDSQVLSGVVDCVGFVVKGNSTVKDVARRGVDSFAKVHNKLLGVVMNDVDFSSRNKHYYQYYYQYYYRYGGKDEDTV